MSIFGEVIRPAKYEILEGETISDLLTFSLGFDISANRQDVIVNRTDSLGNSILLKVSEDDFSTFELVNGDEIIVNKVSGSIVRGINLTGSIRNAGSFEFKENLSVGDLLNLETDLLDNTYTLLGLVKRFDKATDRQNF